MPLSTISLFRQTFSAQFRLAGAQRTTRLQWAILNSAGLRASDIIYSAADLRVLYDVADAVGTRWTTDEKEATVHFLSKPDEKHLLERVEQMPIGHRYIVYNDEREVDALSLRSFEMATASFFDPDSKKVVRLFDSVEPSAPRNMIVEMNEVDDSTLYLQASRIAALRHFEERV